MWPYENNNDDDDNDDTNDNGGGCYDDGDDYDNSDDDGNGGNEGYNIEVIIIIIIIIIVLIANDLYTVHNTISHQSSFNRSLHVFITKSILNYRKRFLAYNKKTIIFHIVR